MDKLTHKGKNVNDIEEFNDADEQLSDNEEKKTSLNYLEEIDKNPNLSRKEIIQNMITNSKKEILEKQRVRMENMDKIQKLDDNFKDLLGIVQRRKPGTERSKDPYDLYTLKLEHAKKTKPTDRIKSEEEIALEKRRTLEKLEKERLRRLKGEGAEEDESGDESDKPNKNPEEIQVSSHNMTKRERIEKLIEKRLNRSQKTTEKENLTERKRGREEEDEGDDEGEDEEDEDNLSDLDALEGEEGEAEDEDQDDGNQHNGDAL